ncbi:flagellar biosynthesis protein FlhF [Virgibacillus byunsanensis]|uniref:Flagellar biosynthesis protein FlhF n=1 Tax=Virgibacillus byunsanensis TaxID=570945 RepID=A0ABW3LKD2_9BACI
MKVKKYVAPTMPEAMHQIRKELGSDAVILNSKEVNNGGFLGLFKKRSIEVIAALDRQPHVPSSKDTSRSKPVIKESLPKGQTDTDILGEIRHLKKMVEQQSSEKQDYKADYKIAYQHLRDQEIVAEIAIEIINSVVEDHENKSVNPELDEILYDTQKEIESRLGKLSFEGLSFHKKIIHLVGPTGVGKTTTLAKVAASSMLQKKKKIAFITADTYRIAAIEQLKTYADILDIPVEVAYDIQGYKAAIKKFEAYDLILVDTAGRNFRDPRYIEELKSNIDFNDDIETFLVLSLTAKPKDIVEIYEQFQHIPIKEVIFTKIDETRQYGSMLNISLHKKMGIAYMTNGQDVPDDLILPTPKVISNYIMGAYRNV